MTFSTNLITTLPNIKLNENCLSNFCGNGDAYRRLFANFPL